MKDSPVMTVRELAHYMKVHKSTIYRMLKRGVVPAFKVGSDWRFTYAAIDEWLADGGAEGYAYGEVMAGRNQPGEAAAKLRKSVPESRPPKSSE